MKCQVPQISWHGRDPVLSVDFQPIRNDLFRLASGGTDSHVLIWYVTYEESKSIKLECASDLYRHNKSVNVVRFSPSGEFLASGDDEGAMFIWELKEREQMIDLPNDDENINKEEWYPVKLLRGHLDDIYDISWSKDGNFLVSASMDNTTILWDMQKYVKTHIFSDFKGYVQGVAWDPCNQFIASVGSDRTLRIHNINSKKTAYKITKAPWTNSTEKGTFKARLFYDDTLQSYFRRLDFTPDGEFLIVPSGILEKGEKNNNTCYIFSRYAPSKPVISLPTGDKYTVAVKCNPFLYKLRNPDISAKDNASRKQMFNLPYRMIFAVAACDSVLMYDTEQLIPFAYISNIHYTHLTDLSWSSDGLTLVVSSTDGYCSFILFTREEMGEIYVPEKIKDSEKECESSLEECKRDGTDNLPSDTVVLNAEKDKIINASSVSKNVSSVTAKSPKSVSNNTKEECVTPASKVKVNLENKKPPKKSPKMCSIKKFFTSPKTVTTAPVSDSVKGEGRKNISGDKPTVSSNNHQDIEVITVSDSPMKVESQLQNTQKTPLKKVPESKSKEILTSNVDNEAMEVDNIPVDGQIPEMSVKHLKQSKCKVRLDFADKEKPTTLIDDNALDTVQEIGSSSNENKTSLKRNTEDESDWKLELSQDEEIVPMETSSSITKNCIEVPKSFDLKDEVTAAVSKSAKPKETAKRRVAFVTLSSKASFKK